MSLIQKKQITLSISDAEIKQLKIFNKKVIEHLEGGNALKINVLEDLKQLLSTIINNQPELVKILSRINDSGDYFDLQFLHPDNEILNLPWSMAADPVSNTRLADIPQLYISKSLPKYYKAEKTGDTLAPPLKILIMISSPEDSDLKSRLSYEQEEYLILQSFEPLMKTGLVQVDFTNDGSLEELERKIKANIYHILHFSGHAVYHKGTGYLMLEKPNNLFTDRVSAKEFSKALNCNPRFKIPLVVLSSCQTAMGDNEEGLRGVTNQLLRIGIPAVVSMGMSIKDEYASYFSSKFYQNIAAKQFITEAFHAALNSLKSYEHDQLVKEGAVNPEPLQWIIPNLYRSSDIEFVVDWTKSSEKLKFSSSRFLFDNNRIILKHEKNYLFIGRRKDKAKVMSALFSKKPVYIRGQGGVGKTSLAEHFVQRLIAFDPSVELFVFNEKTKSIDDIMKSFKAFLEGKKQLNVSELNKRDQGMEQFNYLLGSIALVTNPIFVFDNLESFQSKPDEDFEEAYTDIKSAIGMLASSRDAYCIFTGRYAIPGFEGMVELNLNQVGINDFWKKCQSLELGELAHIINSNKLKDKGSVLINNSALTFSGIVHFLHKTFGGNYRALEFFDDLYRKNPGNIENALLSLESFQKAIENKTDEVKAAMSQNLLFDDLLSLLNEKEIEIFSILSGFRIPVQLFALQLQPGLPEDDQKLNNAIFKLFDLTLIELSFDPEIKTAYFYTTTIIKEFYKKSKKFKPGNFSQTDAGKYYYYNFTNITKSVTELEESFYHYHRAKNKARVQELGDRLSRMYYNHSLFQSAYYYAIQSCQMLGDETSFDLLNRLGLILDVFGKYDESLVFYKKALSISQETGDKSGEGATLNNISQIFKARGDYETALKYLERSLSISQEIGDKSGMIPTLHNMSSIAFGNKDTAKGIEYCTTAYQIALETNDAMGLFHVGQMYGEILIENGKKEEGLSVLKNSYSIGQQAGFPGLEELAAMIEQFENN